MNKKYTSLKFNYSILALVLFLLIFFMNFSFCVLPNDKNVCVRADSQYIPTPPIGDTRGERFVEFTYIFYTSDLGSSWMFDWGDGNYSDWIKVENLIGHISQTYYWSSYGVYNVKIKHKNLFGTESAWSPPLVVTIAPPSDIDNDGWLNEIEESYGSDPKNSNDYPLDTDGDGIADDDSIDGRYKGDLDDDNDGLYDLIEEELKTNPKNRLDVIYIEIKGTDYFLLDINNDGYSDILYNLITNTQSKTSIEFGRIYFDINKDGLNDYSYFRGSIYEFGGGFPWVIAILSIILFSIIIVVLMFKTGILYLYQEEYIEEE